MWPRAGVKEGSAAAVSMTLLSDDTMVSYDIGERQVCINLGNAGDTSRAPRIFPSEEAM